MQGPREGGTDSGAESSQLRECEQELVSVCVPVLDFLLSLPICVGFTTVALRRRERLHSGKNKYGILLPWTILKQ